MYNHQADGFLWENFIVGRQDSTDGPLFEYSEEKGWIVRLRRYAIVPLEQYDELVDRVREIMEEDHV